MKHMVYIVKWSILKKSAQNKSITAYMKRVSVSKSGERGASCRFDSDRRHLLHGVL
jgi:hypothetical protein